MSYQLVYTRAEQLLTPGHSGYGVAARSMGMPRQLVEELTGWSRKHAEGQPALTAPLCTYRITSCKGAEYHVLSCIQDAGASGGNRCRIVHHLALTEEEVLALRRNAARPTPAGITLALLHGQFWLPRWEGEPQLLEREPWLTAAALPDASRQQAWKDLTGHKGNARSFYTPPYDGSCVAELPPEATTGQCLQLLHESDWLTGNRGWGHTFGTPGCTDERGIRRVCTYAGAPGESYARNLRRPLLAINHRLKLPHPAEPAAAARPAAMDEAPRPLLPYHYIESEDEDIYETLAKHRPLRRYIACVSALFLLGAGMYFGASDQADEIGGVARSTMRHFSDWENLAELRNLLAAPYSAEATPLRLEQLRARIATDGAAQGNALKACVDTLSGIARSPRLLATAPSQLTDCAGKLGLPRHQLLRLALLQATQGLALGDWNQRLTPEARDAWSTALSATPQLAEGQSDARLAAFLRELLPGQDAECRTQGNDGPPPIAAPLRPHEPAHAPLVAIAGHPAPPPLLHALAQAPLTLRQGEALLCRWDAAAPAPARQMSLGPGGKGIRIIRGNAEGEYAITPENREWEATLRVRDGIMTELSEGGHPAALKLPLPGTGRAEAGIILLPRVEFPLVPKGLPSPPATPHDGLSLGKPDLAIQLSPTKPGQPRLIIARNKAGHFPWVPAEQLISLEEDAIRLPALSGDNTLRAVEGGLPYNWDASVQEDRRHSIRLRRVYDFSHPLQHEFDNLVNTPRNGKGEASGSTLARAYVLSLEMEPRASRSQAIEQYIALYDDAGFSALMGELLRDEPQWLPTPTSDLETMQQARSRVTSSLSSAPTRKAFRRRLRAAITRRLIERYEAENRRMAGEGGGQLSLVLSHLEAGDDGSLTWHFRLEQTPPTDGQTQE